MELIEKQLCIDNSEYIPIIFGHMDKNINQIKALFHIDLLSREGGLKIIGKEADVLAVSRLIDDILASLKNKENLTDAKFNYLLRHYAEGNVDRVAEYLNELITITTNGKMIKPKTIGQRIYIDNIRKNDVVFGIGPAGTGKTFLAVAMAVDAFRKKEVERIILTRPAVEAGEKLGFLPGDMQDKVDPYLRPLYDALFEIMGAEQYLKNLEKGAIEVAPLAYMRGRTIDSAFIILDEAQNTTKEQMKMFLTRLGYGSKAVITGDVTQIDLPAGKKSGLKQGEKILKDVNGISFIYFDKKDVVRHKLVRDIIKAYEIFEKTEMESH
ncbi:MAG: PhoH family protein [Tissierellales bacterium]|jgi:phosphate starvation-inducible protein PhoH and related proteins|nr:PhoH family protein [Tissierellales bacterium]MBN2827032.1 PhoH family protein [Tissierellales bacterium]